VRYAPLAVERLVAAVCVLPAYAAKPTRRERVSRLRGAHDWSDGGAEGAWPWRRSERSVPCVAFKQEEPQRPEAGQGSGLRAAPTGEASLAMGSLPRCPDPRHTAQQ